MKAAISSWLREWWLHALIILAAGVVIVTLYPGGVCNRPAPLPYKSADQLEQDQMLPGVLQ